MYYQASLKERRAILALAKIIGENEIPNVAKSRYFSAQKMHVYSQDLEPLDKQIFFVSVWTNDRINSDSKCIYAGSVNLMAYDNMKSYFGGSSWPDP